MKKVALLRGINVGKLPRISMKDLKEIFEGLGAANVVTYLNSGNVIFDLAGEPKGFQGRLEDQLAVRLGQAVPALVLAAEDIVRIAGAIPAEWGSNEGEQTYVAYLFDEADRPEIIDELSVKRQFMTLVYLKGCYLWNIKRENFNRSQITRIAEHPQYAKMTVRNVTTARKLAEFCR